MVVVTRGPAPGSPGRVVRAESSGSSRPIVNSRIIAQSSIKQLTINPPIANQRIDNFVIGRS
jgi:hypothetical protein